MIEGTHGFGDDHRCRGLGDRAALQGRGKCQQETPPRPPPPRGGIGEQPGDCDRIRQGCRADPDQPETEPRKRPEYDHAEAPAQSGRAPGEE